MVALAAGLLGLAQGPTPLSDKFTPEQDFAFILPAVKPVEGVDGYRASDCGECHGAIQAEWAASTHAAALRDPQYQAELAKPDSPRWLCLNCHIPVANQRRQRVSGLLAGDVLRPALSPNPDFDLEFQAEAITCAACHLRNDAAGRTVIVGPRGNPRAPHPIKADQATLRSICLRCHDPTGAPITPTLVCWFTTRAELAEGPLGGKKDCVDCHMPATRRLLAGDFDQYPERDSPQHHWVGGGVPKDYAAYDGLLQRGYRPGLEARLLDWQAPAAGAKAVSLRLELTNAHAGHWLPTGDPERFLLATACLGDESGCRPAARLRIGQKWRWVPKAEKMGDNRLVPTTPRIWAAELKPEPKASHLVVEVWHVRLISENAAHMKQAAVDEALVPGITARVRALERFYPQASIIYRETVDLASGDRSRASARELIQRSKAERGKPLNKRIY